MAKFKFKFVNEKRDDIIIEAINTQIAIETYNHYYKIPYKEFHQI